MLECALRQVCVFLGVVLVKLSMARAAQRGMKMVRWFGYADIARM
jgi:hypothetical protein